MKLRAFIADNLPPEKRDEYNAMYQETIDIILASRDDDTITGEAGKRFDALHKKMRGILIQYGLIREQRIIRCWHAVGRRV